jgi:serine/threonine-protein kinase
LNVLEHIGRGSFGDVYRARDPRLDREVALKLVPERLPDSTSSPVVEEGRLLARVRHPNVVSVYGAERIDGHAGIWMEFVRGETLADEANRRGPMSAEEAARIGVDVCGALAAVHAAGLLHRDVKAQNILRDASGRVVLGDFGTGIELEDMPSSEWHIAGTPRYLAPEIFEGQPPAVASDVYSVGVLLYFLVAGDYPVRGRTLSELRLAHRCGERVRLDKMRPDLPPAFVQLVETFLAQAAVDRPGTAAQGQTALQEWLAASVRPAERELIPWWRLRFAGPLAATLIGLVVAAGVFLNVSSRKSHAPPLPQTGNVSPSVHADQPPIDNQPPVVPVAAPIEPTSSPTFRLQTGAWILVAAFDNKTGDPVLDGTMQFLLERELEYSERVRVVQRDRWEDALALIGRPIDSKRTPALALEVARRDGAIAALIEGRVETTGGGYAISMNVVDAVSGETVARFVEKSEARPHIVAAGRRLALRLRKASGEDHVPVDTSRRLIADAHLLSLESLSLYARAETRASVRGSLPPPEREKKWQDVERLLSLALTKDPDFVRALTLKAWAIRNQGRPPEEYLPPAEQATQFSAGVTPQERYFALGSFHDFKAGVQNSAQPITATQREHLEDAVEAYEALLALQPDHYYLFNNLRRDYELLGRQSALAIMMTRVADVQPNSHRFNTEAIIELIRQGNLQAARRYAARAVTAPTADEYRANPYQAVSIRFSRVYLAWLDGNPAESLRLADDAAATIMQVPSEAQPAFIARLVSFYLALGRLRQAEEHAQHVASSDPILLALALRERRDFRRLRDYVMDRWTVESATPRIEFLVAAGMLDEAALSAERISRTQGASQTLTSFLDGQIELALGHAREAIPLFQAFLQGIPRTNRGPASHSAAAKLADALQADGRVPEAIRVLEEATTEQPGLGVGSQHMWVHSRAQLGQLYRGNGRLAEARAIEAELHKLLAVADADHPMVKELTSEGH